MKTSWTEQDFEQISWHDNYVHAMRIIEGEHGSGQFILDIDYILRWDCSGSICEFEVAPAEIKFDEAAGLKLDLDFTGAAFGPFSIDRISRELLEYSTGYKSYKWTINISWPKGNIAFESPSFSQTLRGKSVVTASQCLSAHDRNELISAYNHASNQSR